MKKLIAIAALLASSLAVAQDIGVGRVEGGSGSPGLTGHEQALPVLANDILHAPQYMPAYPTAATIWPRVVEVPCMKGADGFVKCDGYTWTPKLGRGEYLFIKTVLVEPKPPVVIEKEKVVPVIVERKVFIEVPVKKKHE